MRVRTADRRQAIIDAAIQVFREVGYERASMSAISARVGGSKATLYNYFESKETLFAAAMLAVMGEQARVVTALLDASKPDVLLALTEFGKAYLGLVTSEEALSIARAAIAEGGKSELGSRFYESGVEQAWHDVAAFLERLQEQGRIRRCDAHLAAAHLKSLLECGIVEPLLFGALPWFDQADAVNNAVTLFLAAYGPETV